MSVTHNLISDGGQINGEDSEKTNGKSQKMLLEAHYMLEGKPLMQFERSTEIYIYNVQSGFITIKYLLRPD